MNDNSLKKKTTNGVILKTIERFGTEGVSFLVSIVLARILLPEQYGNVSLLLVFVILFDVIVNYGLGTALVQKKNTDNIDFSTCLIANIVITVIAYVVLFLISPFIGKFYKNDSLVLMLRVLGIRTIFSGISSIQAAYVAKNFMFSKSLISTLIASIVSGAIGIAMAFNGYGEWALIIQYLISSIVSIICLAVLLPFKPNLRFDFNRLKPLASFGWKILLLGYSNSLYDEIRSLLIGKKYSASDLAFYDKGRSFPKLIGNNVNAVIDGVVYASMSEVQDEHEKARNLLIKSVQVAVYILSPFLIGLICVSEEFITIVFTDKWIEAAIYLRILCVSYLFSPIITLNMNAFKSCGRSSTVLKVDLIFKAVALVLIFIASYFGVVFIALSTVVSNCIYALMYAFASERFIGYKAVDQIKHIFISVLPSLFMALAIFLVGRINMNSLYLTFVVKVIVGVITFMSVSLCLNKDILKHFLRPKKKES